MVARQAPSASSTAGPSDPVASTPAAKRAASSAPVAGPHPVTPRQRLRRAPRHQASLWGLGATLLFLGVAAYYAVNSIDDPKEYLQGSFYAILVVALCVPIIRHLSKNEQSFDVGSIAFIGLALRLIGTILRRQYASDAIVYWDKGKELAVSFRQLQFDVDTDRPIPGTGTLRYAAGLAQVITFDNLVSTYMIWVFFSFSGTVLFYLAFKRGVAQGDRKRYAMMIFLWPSLVYWPSAIGKEGWMMLTLGLSAYGASRIFTGKALTGVLWVIIGVFFCALVRPHMALLVVLGLATAVIAGRGSRKTRFRIGARTVAVVALVIGGAVLTAKAAEFFKVDNLGTEGVTDALDSTVDQTSQGGSSFAPNLVRSPLDYPKALATVLFRPWIIEARGYLDGLAALEGTLLVVLLASSWRRLLTIPTKVGRQPMVIYATAYTFAFVFAFSSIGNFGILARQRIQVLPMLMLLACLPPVQETRVKGETPRERRARIRSSREASNDEAPALVP